MLSLTIDLLSTLADHLVLGHLLCQLPDRLIATLMTGLLGQ